MTAIFPSPEWIKQMEEKLNSDEQYARIAGKWEGDLLFVIEPTGTLSKRLYYYFDLWHGKCRRAADVPSMERLQPTFIMTGTYDNIKKIVSGELNPMTALMTRKLEVKGSMAVMMRNVPTVLDFVRCANEVTQEYI